MPRLLSPIVVATLQAMTLSCISNLLAQWLGAYRANRPFVLDPIAVLRFASYQLIHAPPNYKWQAFLERSFPAYAPTTHDKPTRKDDVEKQHMRKSLDDAAVGKLEAAEAASKPKLNWRNTMTKWVIDCITVGTVVNTSMFLIVMGIFKGQSFDQIKANVTKETIPIILAGYRVWPLAAFISLTCIPVERRIVFYASIGLLWGIYMSFVAARV